MLRDSPLAYYLISQPDDMSGIVSELVDGGCCSIGLSNQGVSRSCRQSRHFPGFDGLDADCQLKKHQIIQIEVLRGLSCAWNGFGWVTGELQFNQNATWSSK